MKRNICLTKDGHNLSLQNFENVNYNNIDNIINYSVDILYCSILNELTGQEYSTILPLLMNKIRLGGQMVLVIKDVKELCSMYANGSLADMVFVNNIRSLKHIISFSNLEKIIQEHPSLTPINVVHADGQYNITLQRESL